LAGAPPYSSEEANASESNLGDRLG